jgi:hypothetical protein
LDVNFKVMAKPSTSEPLSFSRFWFLCFTFRLSRITGTPAGIAGTGMSMCSSGSESIPLVSMPLEELGNERAWTISFSQG